MGNVDENMDNNILIYRQECVTMTKEQEAREQEELSTGPFKESVSSGIRILVNCTNNMRLLGKLKAFDRHFNMVLVEVLEMWTEQRKRGRQSGRTELVQKGRYISKMFLNARGR